MPQFYVKLYNVQATGGQGSAEVYENIVNVPSDIEAAEVEGYAVSACVDKLEAEYNVGVDTIERYEVTRWISD